MSILNLKYVLDFTRSIFLDVHVIERRHPTAVEGVGTGASRSIRVPQAFGAKTRCHISIQTLNTRTARCPRGYLA